MTHWPFKVVAGAADKPMVEVEYKGERKTFSAEEISSMVLNKMREVAETYLGKKASTGGACLHAACGGAWGEGQSAVPQIQPFCAIMCVRINAAAAATH